MRFRTTIELGGKTATGRRVPPDVASALGRTSDQPLVTIRGHTYHSTVASMGGEFMLPVSAEDRRLTGVAAGDELDVDIVLDTEPRTVTVPPDMARALDSDADARRSFDALSHSNQLRHVLSIEATKSAETRQRRIVKAVSALRAGSS